MHRIKMWLVAAGAQVLTFRVTDSRLHRALLHRQYDANVAAAAAHGSAARSAHTTFQRWERARGSKILPSDGHLGISCGPSIPTSSILMDTRVKTNESAATLHTVRYCVIQCRSQLATEVWAQDVLIYWE